MNQTNPTTDNVNDRQAAINPIKRKGEGYTTPCIECHKNPKVNALYCADCAAVSMKPKTWGSPCRKCGIDKPRKNAWNWCVDCKAKEDERVEKVLTITPEQQKQIEEIRREKTLQSFDRSDLGNAARFEFRHGGQFLHTQATGWLVYRNGLWVEDKTAKADQAMVHTIRQNRREAALVESDEEKKAIIGLSKSSKTNRKIKDALERASKMRTIAEDYADFDR